MSARRSRAAIMADVESVLKRFAPELAAELRALPTPGRKAIRDGQGFTPLDRAHAALWLEMKARVDASEDVADVLADISKDRGISWDRLDRLWRLDGEPHVRRYLRANISSQDDGDATE